MERKTWTEDRAFVSDARQNAIYILYQQFRQTLPVKRVGLSLEEIERSLTAEAVKFACYLLDHPKEWKAAQEMAEQVERFRSGTGL